MMSTNSLPVLHSGGDQPRNQLMRRYGWFTLLICLAGMGFDAVPPAHNDARDGQSRPVSKVRKIAVDDELSPAVQNSIRALEVFTTAWFFVWGAVVGSFLNVVIYRLPRGMNLSHPPSRCSACGMGIEKRDNIPILGWVRLKGRCRNCQSWIPIRYPLVEFAIGLLFLGLCYVELVSGGANLPVRIPNSYAGVIWVIWYTKWDLVGLYLFHLYLLLTLFCATFMSCDGHPLPRRLIQPALCIGLIVPIIWPQLHPAPFMYPIPKWIEQWQWSVSFNEPMFSGWTQKIGINLSGLITGVVGAVAGGLAGTVNSLVISNVSNPSRGHRATILRDSVLTGLLCGLYLGWQAVVTIFVIAVPVTIVCWSIPRLRMASCETLSLCVMSFVTLIHLVLWRTFATLPYLKLLYGQ